MPVFLMDEYIQAMWPCKQFEYSYLISLLIRQSYQCFTMVGYTITKIGINQMIADIYLLLSNINSFQNMAKRLNLKDKMEEINQRFTHKNKAALANDLLQNKLANIQKKMNAFSVKHEQEMGSLKTEALQLLSQLQQNGAVYQQEAQAQLQELEQLSQYLSVKIEGEIIQRKQKENNLIQIMEKKLRMIRNDLQKQKKERTDVIEQITETLKNDVPSLMNQVLEHSAARQQEEEKLAEIIESELGQCQALSEQFKNKQEQSCNKIYGLIRELTLKAKKEVEQQKAIREQTHEQILSYIEQTCNKLAEN